MAEQNFIENAFLGLLIRKPWLISKSIGLINQSNFNDERNKLVYISLVQLYEKGIVNDNNQISEPDYKLIYKEMRNIAVHLSEKFITSNISDSIIKDVLKSPDEWFFYIGNLIADSGVEKNLDTYLKFLIDQKNKQELSKVLSESLSKIGKSEDNSDELITNIEQNIFEISRKRELKDFVKINKITEDFKEKLNKIKSRGYNEGIKAKIIQLDSIIGGFRNGEFIVIAARPSMGKTALAIQIIANISKTKKVGFFSLEMSSQSILQRFISLETNIDQDFLRHYDKLPQNKSEIINDGIKNIESNFIWIDDTPAIKINELIWKVRKLNSMVKLDFIVVDYLQLIEISGKIENRQQSIAEISRSLKAIARELNIPVIALSQLSRKVETRENKRPMMSDLRESGAIEQDADVVLLLYRENYYNKSDNQVSTIVEDLDVIVAKNRNGKVGTAKLDVNMNIGRITSKSLESVE